MTAKQKAHRLPFPEKTNIKYEEFYARQRRRFFRRRLWALDVSMQPDPRNYDFLAAVNAFKKEFPDDVELIDSVLTEILE